jgi:glutamate synthase (NADPH/NADH) small chain
VKANVSWASRVEPVAIGRLERFVADYARTHNLEKITPASRTGLAKKQKGSDHRQRSFRFNSAAGDLAKLGYQVTIFEALHAAGGVLMYGIPPFRLPKDIVQYEIKNLERLGVKIIPNAIIGKTFTIADLMQEEGFAAVYIGTGAGLPHFHAYSRRKSKRRVRCQRVPDPG